MIRGGVRDEHGPASGPRIPPSFRGRSLAPSAPNGPGWTVGSAIVACGPAGALEGEEVDPHIGGDRRRRKNASSLPVASGSRRPMWSSSGRISETPELRNSRRIGRSEALRTAKAQTNARTKNAAVAYQRPQGRRRQEEVPRRKSIGCSSDAGSIERAWLERETPYRLRCRNQRAGAARNGIRKPRPAASTDAGQRISSPPPGGRSGSPTSRT